jgi:hypothetical protein
MEGGWLSSSLSGLSLIGVIVALLLCMFAAAFAGYRARTLRRRLTKGRDQSGSNQESYLIGGMLGLLALLLAFSFSMAVDRYEERRHLVVQEANAIGTAYLRAQLLDQPHRARLSQLLVDYTDNRIVLASASAGQLEGQMAENDRLLTTIWAAVAAARDSARAQGISTPLLLAFNQMIDLDTERKVARKVRVPQAVLLLLLSFLVLTAAVLGFVLEGLRAWVHGFVLFLLLSLYVSIIADLNRPTSGNITESQEPMLMLRQSLQSQPSDAFDRFAAPGSPGS